MSKRVHRTKPYVIVTGANGGIGYKICELFSNNNFNVIATDIHQTFKNPSNIPDGKWVYHSVNLLEESHIKSFMTQISTRRSNVSCFINCAAFQICKPIWEYTENDWDNTYNCNVKSIFLFVKYGIELFKKRKTHIINIASIHSSATSKNISAYASSKAAIVGLTRNMAIDLAQFSIRVNSISPGAINTPMLTEHLSSEQLNFLQDKHLLKKIGTPEQIAQTCLFIHNNTFFNANNITIDGGILAQLASE
jgi:NAD(P)-dependent dehydrogenase (short-subunit alcohol dehydrogenase family)